MKIFLNINKIFPFNKNGKRIFPFNKIKKYH